MDLPFDRVVVGAASGAATLSVDEFLALPFDRRVRAILEKSLQFFFGNATVDTAAALRALRERAVEKPVAPKATAVEPSDAITLTWVERDMLRVEFSREASDAEFKDYLAELDKVLDRGERYVCMCISADIRVPTSQRKLQAEFVRAHADRLGALCIGNAFVLPDAGPRFVLASILLLQRLPMPHWVFENVTDARNWLSRLRAKAV